MSTRFQVRLRRAVYEDYDAVVDADDPEHAIEVARETAPASGWDQTGEQTDEAVTAIWLAEKCPHDAATCDETGSIDYCRDCHGSGWLDLEIPT